MWDLVIGGIVSIFKSKSDIKKAKVEGQIAITKKASENIADWEALHAKGSQTSWKDEFWTVIFAIPLVMGFFPDTLPYVIAGFEALSDMPEWYQYTLVTMVLASFGIRVTGTIKSMIGK